jgi:hypothetical protein
MRNRLLLLTAAVVLSACADDQHTTGPSSRSGIASRSAAGDAAPSGQGSVTPSAKPTDQVGFTTITQVKSEPFAITPGQVMSASATCPAGTSVVGGGYNLTNLPSVFPIVSSSSATLGSNSWWVTIWNTAAGAGSLGMSVYAYCAS